MAVSLLSAAGVVTTQKAAANGVQPIVVNYQPGKTYTYLPKQFNMQSVQRPLPNVKHVEAATGGALYSSISTQMGPSGWSRAQTGVYLQLKLPTSGPYSDWNTVQNMPCKVTMKVNYHIAAKGDFALAQVSWSAGYGSQGGDDWYKGDSAGLAKSAVTTTTWEGTVKTLFALFPDGLVGSALASAGSIQSSTGAGEASAALVCSSIVLEFPQATG